MNIYISGATGFVGQNLKAYFDEHSLASAIISRSELEQPWKLSFSVNSIVIHLAGKAHDLKKVGDPDEYYKVNFGLTKGIFDVFLNSNASKFVFVSSVKAAVDSVFQVLTEDNSPMPETHYGKSKLMAEQYIQSRSLPEGKSYYVLRPCMIHGPRNKGNLNLLYKLVSNGIPYPLASFINKRSFLSVENLCFVIREILERDDIPSGIYNVADDEPLSTNDVVTLLAQAQNKSPRLLNIPKVLISGFAKLGDRLHLPLTSERLQKLTEDFVVSNKKIKEALNKELPLTAREGLLKTARSFRQES